MAASFRDRMDKLLLRFYRSDHVVRDLPVIVVLSLYHNRISTERVIARLKQALDLIEEFQPYRFTRLMRDFNGFVIRRNPTRGAYFAVSGFCLIELTFIGGDRFSIEEVASTIVHESVHARLYEMGCFHDDASLARHERLCRRAEVAFARAIPDGGVVMERAAAVSGAADEEVAPAVDWDLAWQHAALADIRALSAPRWLKRLVAKRQGLDPDSL